jgi:5-methylcytosine-specific restriction endonuclease McrA
MANGQGRDHRAHRAAKARLKRTGPDHCALCGLLIDKSLEWPDPRSWTADHVVPIGAGGSVHGELQPAHKVCNERKGKGDRSSTARRAATPHPSDMRRRVEEGGL